MVCAGDLVLHRVAQSLAVAVPEADVETMAQITSGFLHLHAMEYRPSDAQLLQLQHRQQELIELTDL